MNIIADSLSVKQFDVINGMTVNGLDVKNYIQEQVEDQIQIDTELSNYAKTSALSDYAQTSALTAYVEKTMLSDYAQLSDIADSGEGLTPEQAADIENLKKDVQYLSTLSTEHQLTAAAGSMAYEQKENYLTAVPDGYALTTDLEDYAKLTALADYATSAEMTAYVNQHLTGSADIDLTEYAKKTELSDIPAIKNDIEYLGTLSSEYKLSANAGSLAYKNIEDLEIPSDTADLAATTKDLSNEIGLTYKSFEATSANSGASNAGNYPGFQLKLAAFRTLNITKFDFYRPGKGPNTELSTGSELSLIGTGASSYSGVNASNTYLVSDGSTTYPDLSSYYSFSMKNTGNAIPENLNTLYFYFVDSNKNAQAAPRFSVYGNYTDNYVVSFLHSQQGWFVQLSATAVSSLIDDCVTYNQMTSYVDGHSSSGSSPTNYLSTDAEANNQVSSLNSFYNATIFEHINPTASAYQVAFNSAVSAHVTIDGVRYIVPDDSNTANKPLGKNIPDNAISVNTYDGEGVYEIPGELIATRRWTDKKYFKSNGGTITGDVDLHEAKLSVDSFDQIVDASDGTSVQDALDKKQNALLKEPMPIVGPADRVIASSQFHAGVSLSTALIESGSTYKLYYPVLSADDTIVTASDLASYITQDDLTGQSEAKVFYDLAEAVPSSNEIHLSANAINIFAPTAGDAGTTLSVYMPSQINGHSRDCLLRLDQTSVATSLSVVFVGGSFESEDGEFPVPEANAVNIFSFVETAPHVFDISHKIVKGIN